MTSSRPFEGLFGHISYLATQIRTAVGDCLDGLPTWYAKDSPPLPLLRLAPIFPNLGVCLEQVPAASVISRRYSETPPETSIRAAASDFEKLTEPEQAALSTTVLDALVRWRVFRSLEGLREIIDLSARAQAAFTRGEDACAKLSGLNCLLAECTQEAADAFLDDFQAKWLLTMLPAPEPASDPPPPFAYKPDESAGASGYDTWKRNRFVLIDLEAADTDPGRTKFEGWLESAKLFERPLSSRRSWKAIVVELAKRFPWNPAQVPVRSVSMTPSPNMTVRRGTRVMAMVQELHKAGYQRIRISPGISGSGMHWRCNVTFAANVAADGYSVIDFDHEAGRVALYTSADGADYFQWKGAAAMTAREMAEHFIKAFPRIAEYGAGRDWLYAGWLTEVLGRAEKGRIQDLLALYADYPLDEEEFRLWQPPPPPR